MTKLERLKEKLLGLERRRIQYMRAGKLDLAAKLDRELNDVREGIAEAERYMPAPMQELFAKDGIDTNDIVNKLIECHLAADFLTAAMYSAYDHIKSLGYNPVSLFPEMKEIIKKSEDFASFLCTRSPEYAELVCNNETLVEAIHKKIQTYIQRRRDKFIKDRVKKQMKEERQKTKEQQ